MEHLERLNARAIYAWNKYIGSFYSSEDREMWAYIYILFATERDTIGCII